MMISGWVCSRQIAAMCMCANVSVNSPSKGACVVGSLAVWLLLLLLLVAESEADEELSACIVMAADARSADVGLEVESAVDT